MTLIALAAACASDGDGPTPDAGLPAVDGTVMPPQLTDAMSPVTDATSEGSTDGGAINRPSDPGCPQGLPGPRLVHVPAPEGSAVSSYCIDATEVTNAQYAVFVDAEHPLSADPDVCIDNETYVPESWPPPEGKDEHPVVYVDWCDAHGYCEWAGKHLCGKIGGGESPYEAYADATQSEWYNACSAGGALELPSQEPCNWYGPPGETVPVASMSGCVSSGAYGGVYDLIGNVNEWENSRGEEADLGSVYRIRGGSYGTSSNVCSKAYRIVFGARADVGFRCCADAL